MSELPQTAAADTQSAPSPVAQIATGDINAQKVKIGGTDSITNNTSTAIENVNQFFDDGGGRRVVRAFKESDASHIGQEREEELKELYVGDPALTDDLVEVLGRERILLLTGERGTGKQTTALYVATRIAELHELDHSTALIAPLESSIHVDLLEMANREKFQRCVIVFDDALAKGNASLAGLFGRLDRADCDQLMRQLATSTSYLIITAAASDIDPYRQQLLRQLSIRSVAPGAHGDVEEAYARKVRWISRQRDCAAHVEELVKNRDRIINTLKTIAQVSSFIDSYVKRSADLEAAFADFTDRGRWFRTSLTDDFDAWCSALALLLAQSTRDPEPVAWLDFERLRREISRALKEDDELFPPWRNKERARTPRTLGECVVDDALRDAAQIVVTADGVRFLDHVKTADLWRTALTHNRRVLTAITPALWNLAEQERAAERFTLRAVAAQALGRIGELDPYRSIGPLIRHWGSSEKFGPLVGPLLQGVFGSANRDYAESAWQCAASLVDDDGAGPRLLTAIAAYAQLGIYDRKRAMERLGEIVIEQLAPAIEDGHKSARAAAAVDRAAEGARTKRRAEALRRHRERLAELADAIEDRYKPALLAIGRAVAYIAVYATDRDIISTLNAMRDWISKGRQATGITVAMLFLRAIAGELTFDDPASSPLLFALAKGGKAAVSQFAAFLADLHGSIHSTFALPADVQRQLQGDFADWLTLWAIAAMTFDTYRPAVEDLFVTLARVRGGIMHTDVHTLLGTPAFTDDDAMRTFAIAVRKRLD
jgi:hypothetical protein